MAISLGLGLGIGSVATSGGKPILGTLSSMVYDIDFVAGTAKGGTQPYGSNSNDGRFFRDPSNVTATFCPNAAGTLVSIGASGLRRTNKGVFSYMSGTNGLLWNRDLNGGIAGATWVASNMTAAKTQTGADGTANAATLLTATAANGTISQTVAGNVQRVFSLDIKRVTGTGGVFLSLDGGTSETDISSLITTTYSQQFITQLMAAGSTCRIRLATSGDQVAVDFLQLCTPTISGLNIPTQQRYATTTATVLNSQSRPNVATADAGPLSAVTKGYFAFYWQGRSERPTGGFIITSDGTLFVNVTATGAVKFAIGPGSKSVQTPDSVWLSGLSNLNKVAGYIRSDGVMHVACNGQLAASATTGAGVDTTFTHWDLGTNGAGNNTLMGINERVAFSPNMYFSDATLASMTT